MAKPQEKTASRALRPIAPPPLSQHLRELASRPHAWAVIARNLIPVVGIYGFGWSAALAVFNYWFDGLTALAAIVAALIPRALRETQPKSVGAMWVANLVRGVVTWIFLFRKKRATIYGPRSAVCFTEMPLSSLLDYAEQRANENAVQTIGVALRKTE